MIPQSLGAIGALSLSCRADRFPALVDRTLAPLVLDAKAQIEQDLAIIDLGMNS